MDRQCVLLVVEGETQEPRLFRQIFKEYGLDLDYEIYSYGTNVHDLYDRMFMCGLDEAEDLSLLGVLKELEQDSLKRNILDKNFSDILLVFDYDPHDNRFSPDHLEEMARFFNESTDQGKLYINYPMLEACKHFRKMPDSRYLTRTVETHKIAQYKSIVGSEACYQNYERDYSRRLLDSIIVLTIAKACKVCSVPFNQLNCKNSYQSVDLEHLLVSQNASLANNAPLPVLATCLIFICDYSFDLLDCKQAVSALWGNRSARYP